MPGVSFVQCTRMPKIWCFLISVNRMMLVPTPMVLSSQILRSLDSFSSCRSFLRNLNSTLTVNLSSSCNQQGRGQLMYKVNSCTRSTHVQGQLMYKVNSCTRSCTRTTHVQGQLMYKAISCKQSTHILGQLMYNVNSCTRSTHVQDQLMCKVNSWTRSIHVQSQFMYKVNSCTYV